MSARDVILHNNVLTIGGGGGVGATSGSLTIVFNPFTGTFDYVTTPGAPSVPLKIASGTTFTIASGSQIESVIPIVVDGCMQVDGAWVKNP